MDNTFLHCTPGGAGWADGEESRAELAAGRGTHVDITECRRVLKSAMAVLGEAKGLTEISQCVEVEGASGCGLFSSVSVFSSHPLLMSFLSLESKLAIAYVLIRRSSPF